MMPIRRAALAQSGNQFRKKSCLKYKASPGVVDWYISITKNVGATCLIRSSPSAVRNIRHSTIGHFHVESGRQAIGLSARQRNKIRMLPSLTVNKSPDLKDRTWSKR